jgi:hypothetical protein
MNALSLSAGICPAHSKKKRISSGHWNKGAALGSAFLYGCFFIFSLDSASDVICSLNSLHPSGNIFLFVFQKMTVCFENV